MDVQKHATHIVAKLVKAGYKAYFAGGWVRDYLMDHPSSDIDIATSAPPEKILDLFPHTILLGMAFGVVIVVIEGHQFEVSTFRRDLEYEGGRRPLGVEYSDDEEDALRRDFTINGMFYDPLEKKVIDYVGGAADIEKGLVRTIGVADERFVEDRLRMIRAIRFATRFGFRIDQETQDAIRENADTLFPAVAIERVWSEFTKMAAYPNFDHAVIELHRLGLLQVVLPALTHVHLNEIKQRVAHFRYFPTGISPIFYLLELFPEIKPVDQDELCKNLKVSNATRNLAAYLYSLQIQLKGPEDKVRLVHAFAHPANDICLKVIAAGMGQERELFLEKQRHFREDYQVYIDAIVQKSPLVQAKDLLQRGILPGREMGFLLKEAEKIAILKKITNPQQILEILWSEKDD